MLMILIKMYIFYDLNQEILRKKKERNTGRENTIMLTMIISGVNYGD